jgi:chromosome segregation ATPase
LEGRARERYYRLARLSTERDWYRDQYDSLDALVEALRTDNGWLEYRLQVVWDELLDHGAQTAESASAVDMVRAALLARDVAPQKVREDLAAVQVAAAEREMMLTSVQTQLQQDCATLKEEAKEAKWLRANLVDKVASLATVEEQLEQEGSARQQAET